MLTKNKMNKKRRKLSETYFTETYYVLQKMCTYSSEMH